MRLGDLISREALLKAMEEERQYLLARGLRGAEHILVHHCLPLIDNAPTVDLWKMRQEATENALKKAEELYKRPQGEWIPVSERLPEKEGKCLVTTDFGDVCEDSFVDGIFVCYLGNVIAWQPLPESYRKGGAE